MFPTLTTVHHLNKQFLACSPLFIALGNEIRQKLLMDISSGGLNGMDVNSLAGKSHLSRPAVSHHLKVLKDCGLVRPVKKHTQIFYQLSLAENVAKLKNLCDSLQTILSEIGGDGPDTAAETE